MGKNTTYTYTPRYRIDEELEKKPVKKKQSINESTRKIDFSILFLLYFFISILFYEFLWEKYFHQIAFTFPLCQ